MILELLIILPIGAIVLFFLVGRSIPTPIPNHLAGIGGGIRSEGGLWLTIYRLAILLAAVFATYLVLVANPGGVVAFVLAAVLVWVYVDDLTATLKDVWNANFWRIEP